MKKEKIIIYGTGGTAKFYLENDINDMFEVLAFSDGNHEKWGGKVNDYKIIPPSEICEYFYDRIIIASVYYEEIKKDLTEKYHVPEEKISNTYYGQLPEIRKRYEDYYVSHHMRMEDGTKHSKVCKDDKIVIYTAITGNYDNLKTPKYIDPRCKYVCFTDDRSLKSPVWEMRPLSTDNTDDNRNAKRVKILPHEYFQEYDWSIWVDGALEITGDLLEAMERYMCNSDFLCFMHYRRNGIFPEAEVMKKAGFDDKKIIESQMQRYRKEGFKDDNELIAGGVLLRKHNDVKIIRVMKRWWDEIANNSKRDQLSFNYCAWKENFVFDMIPENVYENRYLKPYPHNKKKC